MRMRSLMMILALGLALAALPASAQRPSRTVGPDFGSGRGRPDYVPGRFIVTLEEGADPEAVAREHGVAPEFVYRHVMRGFAGSMSDAARSGMMRDRRILRVERDAVVVTEQTATQSWGLDRIDQRSLPLNNTFTRNYTGRGVTVYIVDTGILYGHTEFGGRAVPGFDAFNGNGADCNGHGTHVAGVVGGATYGVAPEVTLVSARVLDCNGSGSSSGVIAALDWIAANRRLPAVVNMSLGGPAVQALDDAVNRVIASGAQVMVAAGNEGVDACGSSPARVPAAVTVGASDQNDARASFSNYGSCLDIFAPGTQIPGPYATSTTDLVLMSGTSSATPFVAGRAAMLLQHYPSLTPQQLRDSIALYATKGVIGNALSTNNHLLYSLEAKQGTISVTPTPTVTPVNQPPVANFTGNCTNLGCQFTSTATDPDGQIVSWSWSFGDGTTSTLQSPSHSYTAAGTYTVMLRVTDNAGATSTGQASVTVSAPVAPSITINVRASRSGNTIYSQIYWSGASGSSVLIYRNGVKVATVANSGYYRDVVAVSGSGTLSYKVCASSGTPCSATAQLQY